MKNKILLSVMCLLAVLSLQAQTNGRYIEVTGTSEIEIVPDKIHYLIEIREYFEEEFDGKSKPEEYRTKVSLSEIEQGLRENLDKAGIPQNAIRTQEIGDYWRQQGQDFLVSKKFDITLTDFNQIKVNECPHVPKLAKFKPPRCPIGVYWNTLCLMRDVCTIKTYMI